MSIETVVSGYTCPHQPEETATAGQLAIVAIVTVVAVGLMMLGLELGLSLTAAGLI